MNIEKLYSLTKELPFIEIDYDINLQKLINEYELISEKYNYENYKTTYPNEWVKEKYARSWSGISLISSDGSLYRDMYEGEDGASIKTELTSVCPYIYEVIDKLGGGNLRSRIMRITPNESLIWHSHVLDHKQPDWQLTVQIPIVMPEQFEYCVVHKDNFSEEKRLFSPDEFTKVARKKLEAGKAYIFNSYHYHNVYNYSNEYRITLMVYLDLRQESVQDIVKNSINKKLYHTFEGDVI